MRSVAVAVLVLEAGCDYLPWRFPTEYRDTIPGAALVYLPGAEHQAYLERPGSYFAAVRAFLLVRPPPAAPYTTGDPRPDYTGPR